MDKRIVTVVCVDTEEILGQKDIQKMGINLMNCHAQLVQAYRNHENQFNQFAEHVRRQVDMLERYQALLNQAEDTIKQLEQTMTPVPEDLAAWYAESRVLLDKAMIDLARLQNPNALQQIA